MTGSFVGRGKQYIQLVKVLYCKLPTNSKQLSAFPLEVVPGTEPRSQKWEARVLPLCHRAPPPSPPPPPPPQCLWIMHQNKHHWLHLLGYKNLPLEDPWTDGPMTSLSVTCRTVCSGGSSARRHWSACRTCHTGRHGHRHSDRTDRCPPQICRPGIWRGQSVYSWLMTSTIPGLVFTKSLKLSLRLK